jgi:hypothetical protein
MEIVFTKKDVKVTKNIRCRPGRLSGVPAKRCAAEGFVRNEAELQMIIDPVHYGIVCNKSAGSLRLA